MGDRTRLIRPFTERCPWNTRLSGSRVYPFYRMRLQQSPFIKTKHDRQGLTDDRVALLRSNDCMDRTIFVAVRRVLDAISIQECRYRVRRRSLRQVLVDLAFEIVDRYGRRSDSVLVPLYRMFLQQLPLIKTKRDRHERVAFLRLNECTDGTILVEIRRVVDAISIQECLYRASRRTDRQVRVDLPPEVVDRYSQRIGLALEAG